MIECQLFSIQSGNLKVSPPLRTSEACAQTNTRNQENLSLRFLIDITSTREKHCFRKFLYVAVYIPGQTQKLEENNNEKSEVASL